MGYLLFLESCSMVRRFVLEGVVEKYYFSITKHNLTEIENEVAENPDKEYLVWINLDHRSKPDHVKIIRLNSYDNATVIVGNKETKYIPEILKKFSVPVVEVDNRNINTEQLQKIIKDI